MGDSAYSPDWIDLSTLPSWAPLSGEKLNAVYTSPLSPASETKLQNIAGLIIQYTMPTNEISAGELTEHIRTLHNAHRDIVVTAIQAALTHIWNTAKTTWPNRRPYAKAMAEKVSQTIISALNIKPPPALTNACADFSILLAEDMRSLRTQASTQAVYVFDFDKLAKRIQQYLKYSKADMRDADSQRNFKHNLLGALDEAYPSIGDGQLLGFIIPKNQFDQVIECLATHTQNQQYKQVEETIVSAPHASSSTHLPIMTSVVDTSQASPPISPTKDSTTAVGISPLRSHQSADDGNRNENSQLSSHSGSSLSNMSVSPSKYSPSLYSSLSSHLVSTPPHEDNPRLSSSSPSSPMSTSPNKHSPKLYGPAAERPKIIPFVLPPTEVPVSSPTVKR